MGRPALFFPFARLTGNRQLLDHDTELVVDGFPRSGNSFAEAAFLHSQRARGIALKSHAHSPAQILRAMDKGVAAVLLLRDPDDAVASMIAASGVDQPDIHYRDYCAYYRPLKGREAGFVITPFALLLERFDLVVQAINARFGMALDTPEVHDEFVQSVNSVRDRVSIARVGRAPNYSPHSEWGVAGNRAGQAAILTRLGTLDGLPSRQAALKLHAYFAAHVDTLSAGDPA
ncbi:hypothetical protein AAV99_08390 [Aurantiacibacter marinus]|uniref:Sulfotransferase domain-containing protein n=1 Tax=Aurantiacibacter marinus TaxID=874156 RepID=A0A0H0XMY8_9SPHN|nr:hypothetical protein AAV99_08390 [Aurantiacibacter marinus]